MESNQLRKLAFDILGELDFALPSKSEIDTIAHSAVVEVHKAHPELKKTDLVHSIEKAADRLHNGYNSGMISLDKSLGVVFHRLLKKDYVKYREMLMSAVRGYAATM